MKSRDRKSKRREEKRREEERRKKIKKRKSPKKEDPGARKGRKIAKHCVFPMICGSGGSKSRLAKEAGAEPSGEMRDEKLTLRHTTPHLTTPYTQLHYTTLPYPTLHFITLHCATLITPPQVQLQLHYTNYTTPQLQLHYTKTTTTAVLHHTTSSSCEWGDRPGDHCNHCSHSKKHSSNHLSVHQWIRSAIRDSQQPISPIGFLFSKLPQLPCAVLLVVDLPTENCDFP